MNLGIFGGTFDPVHYGHLILAEVARELCLLDQVRFLPAFIPPHKQGEEISSGKNRVEMLQFATAGYPEFLVDERELKREGTSYTVETLTEIKDEFPDSKLHFLMGADSLIDLPNWKQPEQIAELARIVAVNRAGTTTEELDQIVQSLPASMRPAITILQMPEIGISASQIRSRVSEKGSIRFLTPRPVERYIVEHRLYHA